MGEVGGVQRDDESAVVAGTGHGPAAGRHRGPRQVDVHSGAGPLSAFALDLLVGAVLAFGGALGLVLALCLLAEPLEVDAGLGALHLHLPPTSGLLAPLVLLAARQRGQGLGLVAGGPGLG
ncbi:hypothetical protein GCM10010442_44150 [Kitasatospora kifunensis]